MKKFIFILALFPALCCAPSFAQINQDSLCLVTMAEEAITFDATFADVLYCVAVCNGNEFQAVKNRIAVTTTEKTPGNETIHVTIRVKYVVRIIEVLSVQPERMAADVNARLKSLLVAKLPEYPCLARSFQKIQAVREQEFTDALNRGRAQLNEIRQSLSLEE